MIRYPFDRGVTSKLFVLGALILPCLATATFQDKPLYVNDRVLGVDSRFPPKVFPPDHVLDDTVPWKSQIKEFDPEREYTPEQQAKIIEDEIALTGAKRLPVVPGGMVELEIDQGLVPEALSRVPLSLDMLYPFSSLDVASEEINICPFNQQIIIDRQYSKTYSMGNDLFGAACGISASLKAKTVLGGVEMESQADGFVEATVFGAKREVVRASAYVKSTPTNVSGSANLFIMGGVAWSKDISTVKSFTSYKQERHFFQSRKTFMVGPVPISVTSSISGSALLKGEVSSGTNGISLAVAPEVSVGATASAGVDVWIVGFGIQGSLRLIEVSFPVGSSITVTANNLPYEFKVERKLATLSGEISLYAVVRFIFFKVRWDLTIARWSGWQQTETLYSVSGSPPRSLSAVAATASAPVP